jgi:hypothetical protein
MLNVFADGDSWLWAGIFAAGMLGAWALGVRWRGRALRKGGGDELAGRLVDASLALLGLLLAFTFSMSLSRHQRRWDMVVVDSNSIGDFYTCASLLKDPVRTKLQVLLREYVELRLGVAGGIPTEAKLQEGLRKADQLHDQMTRLVAEALDEGTPIAYPLVTTFNAMVSNQASRLSAYRDRLPLSIVVLLFVAAAVSSGLVGFQQGSSGKRELLGTFSFVLLIALVVWVTLDLNEPRRGLITVSQEPMERLLKTMSQ